MRQLSLLQLCRGRRVIVAIVVAFVVLALAAGPGAWAFYSASATEARISFRAPIEISKAEAALGLDGLNASAAVRARVARQVRHLIGFYQSGAYLDGQFGRGFPAAPSEEFNFQFVDQQGAQAVYEFNGKILVDRRYFAGKTGQVLEIPVVLPINPEKVYAQTRGTRSTNPCTDSEFNDTADFWYFWDLSLPGCNWQTHADKFFQGTARTVALPNSRVSYPEYQKLYGDNGNGRELTIAIFIGYLERNTSHDPAAEAFRRLSAYFDQTGFAMPEHADRFREYRDGRLVHGDSFYRQYTKTVRTQLGPTIDLKVSVLLSDTNSDIKDQTFHQNAAVAFAEADIVIYDGHSGLGANLDLQQFPNVTFHPSKYQIFFFNGCGTYPFYNRGFFQAKGGVRNLEILTTGVETYGATSAPNAIAFLEPFLEGRTPTYQKLLSDVEASSGKYAPYLIGVAGDEDNSFSR